MASWLQSLVRIANGLAANDGTGADLRSGASTLAGNFDAVKDAVNAIASSQNSGLIAYATKAAMDADLSKPDGALAQVTNDATMANNQSYRKSGASGTGSWVASVDRISQVSQDLADTVSPSKSAALVGYVRDAVGSRLATVGGFLDAQPGNVWEYSDLAVKPDGAEDDPTQWDWTAAFQAAIDNHYKVEVPSGDYNIRKITWRSNVVMHTFGSVRLLDIPGDTNDCCISFGQGGAISQWELSGQIRLIGCGNTVSGGPRNGLGKCGVMLDSTPGSDGQGGNWYFRITGLRVYGFTGHQVWERGGATGDATEVNQFGVYGNCYFKAATAGSYAFLASGKNGQRSFDGGCLFEHTDSIDSAFYLSRHRDASGALTGQDASAYNFASIATSFQFGNPCLRVERGRSCMFQASYIENAVAGALFDISCENCYFEGTLAKAHSNAGAGYAIKLGSVGSATTQALTLGKVIILGNGDTGINGGSGGAGANGGIAFSGTVTFNSGTTTTPFTNCTGQVAASGGAINLYGRSSAIVNGPATITTITSNVAPGQIITLKSNADSVTYGKGGNITIPNGRTTVTVPRDGSATFVRTDLAPKGYLLVGAVDPTWA